MTAKLSRRFYEQFGDEITNELVDWFNNVDATYRSDLRDINELNFARFDAKMEQRFAESDVKWEKRYAELDAKIDKGLAGVRADLRVEIQTMKTDLIKWMFLFWTGSMIAQAGLLFAVLRGR